MQFTVFPLKIAIPDPETIDHKLEPKLGTAERGKDKPHATPPDPAFEIGGGPSTITETLSQSTDHCPDTEL